MASRNLPGTFEAGISKAERQKRVREEARKLREQEARRSKRNKIFLVIGAVVAIALVATAVAMIVISGKKGVNVIDEKVPANVTDKAGITLGKDLKAGTTNAGKPTVSVYYDYTCIHCNEMEKTTGKDLIQLAKQGDITLKYQPTSILRQSFGILGAQADFFVASTEPQHFSRFHHLMFSELSDPLSQAKSQPVMPTATDIVRVAKEAGVSDAHTKDLQTALNKGTYAKLLRQADQQFAKDGYTGTPTILLNGKVLDNWPAQLKPELEKAVGHSVKLSIGGN